jgi:hypothetical protein
MTWRSAKGDRPTNAGVGGGSISLTGQRSQPYWDGEEFLVE